MVKTAAPRPLDPVTSELARSLRLVLTDCDGVLTDGGVYYSEQGEELKRFSFRDGMGIARLREHGVDVGIVTGETSPALQARARKLAISELHQGVADKLAVVTALAERQYLTFDQIGYIGDDLNDLAVLRAVGLSAAPADAEPLVAAEVHVVVDRRGGHGAFRAFAELIVMAKRGRDPWQ